MKTYLFRTRGINNSYYPDKEDKYAFNENAPNCERLLKDIKNEGINFYLYLINTGEIVEKGKVSSIIFEANMYYAMFEERKSLNPSIKLPKWPSPEKGIVPLSNDEIEEIENSYN